MGKKTTHKETDKAPEPIPIGNPKGEKFAKFDDLNYDISSVVALRILEWVQLSYQVKSNHFGIREPEEIEYSAK